MAATNTHRSIPKVVGVFGGHAHSQSVQDALSVSVAEGG